jgi:hypothetical protein
MSDRAIRIEKPVTLVEAHPDHRYVADDRLGGNAIVERAYEARCPRCPEERVRWRSERDQADISTHAKR